MSTRSYPVRETHPLAEKTVRLNENAQDGLRGIVLPGAFFTIEDWWENMEGQLIVLPRPTTNWAEMHYVERLMFHDRFTFDQQPTDAVYGKIGNRGHLVHVSELGEVLDD